MQNNDEIVLNRENTQNSGITIWNESCADKYWPRQQLELIKLIVPGVTPPVLKEPWSEIYRVVTQYCMYVQRT